MKTINSGNGWFEEYWVNQTRIPVQSENIDIYAFCHSRFKAGVRLLVKPHPYVLISFPLKGFSMFGGSGIFIRDLSANEPEKRFSQAGNYLLAANQMGLNVQGIYYVICQKPGIKRTLATPADKLEYKKDGTLYSRCRLTDETLEEFAARVAEWYSMQNRFAVQSVYRTPDQLKTLQDDLLKVTGDMYACEKAGAYYRNPEACRNLPCAFEAICLEDSPELRSNNFTLKSAVSEELEENIPF